MQENWDKFYHAYQAATPEVKAIIDSTLIPTCVQQAVTTYQLDTTHYRELVKLYSLYILKVVDEPSMIEEMRRLGIPNSQAVFSGLQICRATTPVIPVSFDEPDDLSAEISEAELVLSQTVSTPDFPPATTPSPIPSPPVFNTAPPPTPITPVYSSTQAAILNERSKPALPIPNFEGPRWESDGH